MSRMWSRIRDAVLLVQCLLCVAMLSILGKPFFPLCAAFGVAGLAVLLLTIALDEPLIQKGFLLLAGAAGSAALATLTVFWALVWAGRPPPGDGGGITVAMLIVVCPIAFTIGAVGAGVYRIVRRGIGTRGAA